MLIERIVINKGFSDIDPVSCGREACASKHSYGPAARSYILLHFVLSGKGRFKTPRGEYDVKKDQMFIIRPNEITYYIADEQEPWEYAWLGFNASIKLPDAIEKQDVITEPALRDIFLSAYNESGDKSLGLEWYTPYLCSKLWELISFLVRREAEEAPDIGVYTASAVAIMEAEYESGINVSDIARRLHLNRTYFESLFRAHTGVSPAKYLSKIRMERALSLMTDFGHNVSVTALSVGYSDVFSFSRAFKRYYGVSPKEKIK